MRQEIDQQPAALAATLDALLPLVGELGDLARGTRQVLFLARGSSDNAAVYGRSLIELHTGHLATLGSPSTATVYRKQLDLDGVLAVAISQSGATEEIVEAAQWAKSCGARTVAITNEAGSLLESATDLALVTHAGKEHAVPATKTYTAQLLALAVLAHAMAPSPELERGLHAIPGQVTEALLAAEAAAGLAEWLVPARSLVVTGRGYCQSTALELALKLKETCYLNAAGLSVADLLHGPIAVLDEKTPALIVAPTDSPVIPGLLSLVERIRSVGAPIFAIGGGDALAAVCDGFVPSPAVDEVLAPIPLIVPGQLVVESLARAMGIDPDAPRSLTKVTQT